MASARSRVKRIRGTIAPFAAAATGFAGINETSHAPTVCVCPLATSWLAASAALPYINHTASTSTITWERGIFCCAAYASIVRSKVFSFSRLADFTTK